MHDDLIRIGLVDDGDIILDEAALSLALLDHPGADLEPYQDVLDAVAARLDEVGAAMTGADERAAALAQVLGGEFGFSGDRETYDDPANADMIRVIDRRRGLPVSLSILYVAAARRCEWIASVLDVPGHVLVLIGDAPSPVIIDPFDGGSAVDRDRLAALLASHGGQPAAAKHVAAMPNRAVLLRLLLNQATRAEQGGKGRRALDLYIRMTTMAPEYALAWWERARLELVDGDVAAARSSLSAMLEITREPELRSRVTDLLDKLVAD